MGNHEYCEICGEDDFHRHRPCDQKKVAERKARGVQAQAEEDASLKQAEKLLTAAGIPYRVDRREGLGFPYASISYTVTVDLSRLPKEQN
jgi:hypothetical protein